MKLSLISLNDEQKSTFLYWIKLLYQSLDQFGNKNSLNWYQYSIASIALHHYMDIYFDFNRISKTIRDSGLEFDNDDVEYSYVRIIQEMREDNIDETILLQEFINRLNIRLANIKNSETYHYLIITSTNLKLSSPWLNQIDNTIIEIQSKHGILSNHDFNQQTNDFLVNHLSGDYDYILIHNYSKEPINSYYEASLLQDSILGMFYFQFEGYVQANNYSNFGLGKNLVLTENKGIYTKVLETDGEYLPPTETIGKDKITQITALIENLKTSKISDHYWIRLFQIYFETHQTNRIYSRFHYLWVILELLVGKFLENKISFDEIVSRIKYLLRNKSSFEELEIINIFLHKRNMIVHEYHDRIQDVEINHLSAIVYSGIIEMLKLSQRYDLKEIKFIFRKQYTSKEDLNNQIENLKDTVSKLENIKDLFSI